MAKGTEKSSQTLVFIRSITREKENRKGKRQGNETRK
jgi:hypothetical protein